MEYSKEPKKIMGLKYVMKRKDIMTFVSGLHDMQADMIEELVKREERKGFPQVQEVLKTVKRRL
jgi:hypothetical protein